MSIIDLSQVTEKEDFLSFDKSKILNNLDPVKETIIYLGYLYDSSYSHIVGYFKELYTVLAEKYNIIFIGYIRDKTTDFNTIKIELSKSKNFVAKFCKRKKEYGCEGYEYNIDNHKKIYEYINAKLNWITNIKYITGIDSTAEWRMPIQQHTIAGKHKIKYNEFHDYVGDNKEELQEINDIVATVCKTWTNYCNPLAFSQINGAVLYNILLSLVNNNKSTLKSIDNFANDPAQFSPILESFGVPSRHFYFENDTRGTRNFRKFPIAELQHLVYDIHYEKEHNDNLVNDFFSDTESVKHNKNFFFMGTLLNVKGGRSILWSKYLKGFQYDKSSFYIPPVKQGILFKRASQKVIDRRQKMMSEDLFNILHEIESHPLYKGYVVPEEVNATIEQYKYTLILRCVSYYDSLNYRPVLYTFHRILFFLDPQYDPACLQIPKKIQEKLIVNNAKEIEDKIDYFEQHPDEREEILNQLWKHFEIDKCLQPNYYKDVILSYYS